jgi:hypothetical protein
MAALYDLEDYRGGAKSTQGATGYGYTGYTGLAQGTSKPNMVRKTGTITAGIISLARAVIFNGARVGPNSNAFTAGSTNVTSPGAQNYTNPNVMDVGDKVIYHDGLGNIPYVVTVASIVSNTNFTITAPAPITNSATPEVYAFGSTLYSRVGIFRVLPGTGGGTHQQDRQLLGIITFTFAPPANPYLYTDTAIYVGYINTNGNFEEPFLGSNRGNQRLQRVETSDGIYAATELQPRTGVGTLGANVGIPVQAGWLVGASLLYPTVNGSNVRYPIVDAIANGGVAVVENYDFAHRYRYAIGGYAGVKLSLSVT